MNREQRLKQRQIYIQSMENGLIAHTKRFLFLYKWYRRDLAQNILLFFHGFFSSSFSSLVFIHFTSTAFHFLLHVLFFICDFSKQNLCGAFSIWIRAFCRLFVCIPKWSCPCAFFFYSFFNIFSEKALKNNVLKRQHKLSICSGKRARREKSNNFKW